MISPYWQSGVTWTINSPRLISPGVYLAYAHFTPPPTETFSLIQHAKITSTLVSIVPPLGWLHYRFLCHKESNFRVSFFSVSAWTVNQLFCCVDMHFDLAWSNCEYENHSEVNLFGWQDVQIQELISDLPPPPFRLLQEILKWMRLYRYVYVIYLYVYSVSQM